MQNGFLIFLTNTDVLNKILIFLVIYTIFCLDHSGRSTVHISIFSEANWLQVYIICESCPKKSLMGAINEEKFDWHNQFSHGVGSKSIVCQYLDLCRSSLDLDQISFRYFFHIFNQSCQDQNKWI